MDAILFSSNPDRTDMDDAIRFLQDHKELYWSVGFQIDRNQFTYPMYGYMHISGEQVEYRATIRDIVPFSQEHYSPSLKPEAWIREQKEKPLAKMNSLVMTEIVPFSYDTCSLKRVDGTSVQAPPRGYVRVVPPGQIPQLPSTPGEQGLTEKELERILVEHPAMIEPGLRLMETQVRTPAGRIDLLCSDANGNHVVVERKKMQGSDQAMGQILRYMGWLMETHPGEKVRGIVVGRKDQALLYAAKAVPDVQVKEFHFAIQ
jgi:hypothetical protein